MMKRFAFLTLFLPGLLLTVIRQDPILQQFFAEQAEWATWKIWLLPLFFWLMIMGLNIRKWKNWGSKTFFLIDVVFAGLVALGLILIHLVNHILSIAKGNESDPN